MGSVENRSRLDIVKDKGWKYKWLFLVRLFLTSFLLFLSIYAQFSREPAQSDLALVVVYIFVTAIFCLSLLYLPINKRLQQHSLLIRAQLGLDTFIVSLIIFVTGGYYSFFSFLYLVVIIYSNMILYLRGGLVVAALSSFQYALLIVLEYTGVLLPLANCDAYFASYQGLFHAASKVLITTTGCFAVAVLSGLLTEQNRKSQSELKDMENHVKRVEKMAYMGEMAAGLAHEIKNPMASLVGSIQLLKDELPYSSDHQYLMDIILRETDRLSTLVTDFLFFARPPAGKPEKIQLKTAIAEIGALFEKDSSHAGRLSFVEHVGDNLWILMDPVHFRQVLWNLILNAAEATSGPGSITIAARKRKNQDIEISVEDNGCGIPPDKMACIFDPFFTTKLEGTGLGLSIVHRILESYSSRLEVQSKEDEGTIFSFALKPVLPS